MRWLLLIFLLLITGCRSLGDLEVLNDVGLSEAGEVIRAYDKTMNVLGHPRTTSLNTSSINTGYGNAKQLPDHMNDVPTAVAEIQDVLRYVQK